MMSFELLTILCMATAVASFTILNCTKFVGHQMSVEIDGENVEYSEIEAYYLYKKDNLYIEEYSDGKSAPHLELDDTAVVFSGIAVKDSVINEKLSFDTEKVLSTTTTGYGTVKNQGNRKTLSDCSLVVKKWPNETNIWPESLTETLFLKIKQCLRSDLCAALGNIQHINSA